MGLTEANQVLTLNNLRHKVTLRTDGHKDRKRCSHCGNDGCGRVWRCNNSSCCNGMYNGKTMSLNMSVGVCTQDEKLREKF